jgi:hypothetical protein
VTSFWLAAVLTAASFCQQPIRTDSRIDYFHKEGGFSISFPGKPKQSDQTAKGPTGEVRVFTATYSDGNGNVFLVSYSDLPTEATKIDKLEALFEGVRDGAKRKDWKILEDDDKKREFGPNKLPSRFFEMGKEKQRMNLRLIVSGQRLYQITVSGSADLLTPKDIEDFIGSFKIISK